MAIKKRTFSLRLPLRSFFFFKSSSLFSFYHGIWYPYGDPCRNPNYDYQIFLDWDRYNSCSLTHCLSSNGQLYLIRHLSVNLNRHISVPYHPLTVPCLIFCPVTVLNMYVLYYVICPLYLLFLTVS